MSSTQDTRPRAPTPKPTTPTEQAPTRRPYTGSCSCGHIKFIIFLTLPFTPPYGKSAAGEPPKQMLRKCNCTVCHKSAFFHISLSDPPNDFMLLSPLDPVRELKTYKCGEKRNPMLFCPGCGIRTFIARGAEGDGFGKAVSRDLSTIGLSEAQLKRLGFESEVDAKDVKAYVPVDEWGPGYLLRVNAFALDADQKGLDLREWQEKGWVQYVNWYDEVQGAASHERPYRFGAY